MSYEYKDNVIDAVDEWFDYGKVALPVLKEIKNVYAQAAEYKEYRTATEVLVNTLTAKADEYEAKAKALDRVREFAEEPPFLLANNENEDYERYAYDQILKLINHYESGESKY